MTSEYMFRAPDHRMQMIRSALKCRFPSWIFRLLPTFWSFQNRNSECTNGQLKQPRGQTHRIKLPAWRWLRTRRHPFQRIPYTLENLIGVLSNSAFYTRLSEIEKSTANTLRNKLFYTLGRSGMLDWTPTETTPYLPINELMVGGRVSVLDVSETDDRSRNIAIAFVLQSLFNKVTETAVGETIPHTEVPRPKILLVIEEVHTFVSKQSINKMKSVLDNLQTISRRGRKRWLSLALVSQQPGHVPEELFELANTRFIHQLKSVMNIAPVKQTTGGVHEALWSTIPALGPGQCLLTGRTFKNPLLVNVRPAKSKRLLTS
jgi:uncharacterized protein